MKFNRFFALGLLANVLAALSPLSAKPLKEGGFQYDVEMFTFYPYHCESTLMGQMKKVFHLDTFIETGTLGGETAFCASPIFNEVLSVELGELLFQDAQRRNVYPNVSLYQDSSDLFLGRILSQLQAKKKLFWLDAHFSGGTTATLIDEATKQPKAPIWGELTAILKDGLRDSLILIDDISGYLLDPQASMRYPHLHHQYNLIKSFCSTAQLYVVGDLALVYDATYHSPKVSPIVQDCTTSRMFDWYTSSFEDEEAVLEAEYDLVKRCYESEADRVCYLSGYCCCRDYRLWRALVHLGRGNFVQAAEDFQYVKDNGMTHWRIDFYHAYALAKSGDLSQSESVFSSIASHITDHALFLNTNYPY